MATRMLVDQIGQGRPGPTIYSSVALDPHAEAIASMHSYLADRLGDRPLPWDPSLFAYVQPENVRDSLLDGWPEPSERSTSRGEVLPSIDVPTDYRSADAASPYEAVQDVPTWVAASHRYLGSEYAKLARSADPVAKAVVRNAYDRGRGRGTGRAPLHHRSALGVVMARTVIGLSRTGDRVQVTLDRAQLNYTYDTVEVDLSHASGEHAHGAR